MNALVVVGLILWIAGMAIFCGYLTLQGRLVEFFLRPRCVGSELGRQMSTRTLLLVCGPPMAGFLMIFAGLSYQADRSLTPNELSWGTCFEGVINAQNFYKGHSGRGVEFAASLPELYQKNRDDLEAIKSRWQSWQTSRPRGIRSGPQPEKPPRQDPNLPQEMADAAAAGSRYRGYRIVDKTQAGPAGVPVALNYISFPDPPTGFDRCAFVIKDGVVWVKRLKGPPPTETPADPAADGWETLESARARSPK